MDFNKIAKDTLDFNSKAVEVYITSDGTPFLNNGSAKWHAGNLKDTKIRTFDHDGEVLPEGEVSIPKGKDSDKTKFSADSLIIAINKSESMEELEELPLEGETRKTVVAAYEAKKAELEKGSE